MNGEKSQDPSGMLSTPSEAMQEFVESVRRRAGLEKTAEAEELARAGVAALGRAISGGEADRLAQWLPEELAGQLTAQRGHAGRFDKDRMLETVGARVYTVDVDRVQTQVRAVLQTIRAGAPGEELSDAIAQLPPDIAEMFGSER